MYGFQNYNQVKHRFTVLVLAVLFIALPAIASAVDHPFLLVNKSEFQGMRDKVDFEPWRSMKADASTVHGQPVPVYVHDNPTAPWKDSQIHAQKLARYIRRCALGYILEPAAARDYALQVYYSIKDPDNGVEALTFDPIRYYTKVPSLQAFFNAVLALDVVYDSLESSERDACEDRLDQIINDYSQLLFSIYQQPGQTEDETIRDSGHGLSYYGAKGIWEIYTTQQTDLKESYYNYLMLTHGAEGPCYIGSGYTMARRSGEDRFVKSIFMDVLEYTGLDRRYYNSVPLSRMYEWLYSESSNHFRNGATFGDTTRYTNGANTNAFEVGYRAGNFSDLAAESFAWYHVGKSEQDYRPGTLIAYAVPDNVLPAPRRPVSKVYRDGGGWFREDTDSIYGLMGVLYNVLGDGLAHAKEETNALYLSGYGQHLLINSGVTWEYSSVDKRYSWAYANNTLSTIERPYPSGSSTYYPTHEVKYGNGIVEGFTTNWFDYARGDDGGALPNDSHFRNFFFVHPNSYIPGYFFMVDEVDSSTCEDIKTFLHPNSNNIIENVSLEKYTANIDAYVKDNIKTKKLTIFYGERPQDVEIKNTPLSPLKPTKYLQANYDCQHALKNRIPTILFPHDETHSLATMVYLKTQTPLGMVYNNNTVIQNLRSGYVQDEIFVSDGTDDIDKGNHRFQGEIVYYRSIDGIVTSFFLRDGVSFAHKSIISTDIPNIRSVKPISAYFANTVGKITSKENDISIQFEYPGITGVRVDGQLAPLINYNSNMIEVKLNGGTHDIELDFSGQIATPTEYIYIPTDDAYVSDSNTNVNYGSNTRLRVQCGDDVSKSYLNFDISGYNKAAVTSAKLKLFVISGGDYAYSNIYLESLSTSAWDESTISWNNQPSGTSTLIERKRSASNERGRWHEFDVTSYINSRLKTGANEISFIASNNCVGNSATIDYGSKEGATNQPTLVLSYDEEQLTPQKDALVRGGSYADNNYGTLTQLMVKNGASDSWDRKSYLSFDLSDYSDSNIASAKLKVYANQIGTDTTRVIRLYSATDSNWGETSITWNNSPDKMDYITQRTIGTALGWYSFDVTDYVANNIKDNEMTFIMINEGTPGSANHILFSSLQGSSNKPYLEIIRGNAKTVTAEQDAFVRGGIYANYNYGSHQEIIVKNGSNPNFDRKSYLLFHINNRRYAQKALLRLYVTSAGTDLSRTISVFGVYDDEWGESNITWNNAPPPDEFIESYSVSNNTGVWVEFDVTPYLNDNIDEQWLGFMLENTGPSSSAGHIVFRSKDSTSPEKPELFIW